MLVAIMARPTSSISNDEAVEQTIEPNTATAASISSTRRLPNRSPSLPAIGVSTPPTRVKIVMIQMIWVVLNFAATFGSAGAISWKPSAVCSVRNTRTTSAAIQMAVGRRCAAATLSAAA